MCDKTYICGDFNEEMHKDSAINKFLTEKKFKISDDLQKKLNEEKTCDKMRSGLQ